ncbi:MAG: endonuclease/exonuclease/phosphatase family protein [Phycisphaerales bacterium]|jgi:endonuclease/exonuclease/phosphatase family metal-dependent hydrolase|nr:endonuclease/exonuclease/phosphatase family protein [Phycisphaerales bacterium]
MIDPSLFIAAATLAASPIQLDGDFYDWAPQGDAPALTAACTRDHVFLHLTLDGPPVNLQGLDAPLTLSLNWDNDTSTSLPAADPAGTDVEIVFSPRSGRRTGGIAVKVPDRSSETWDAAGLVFSPTAAASAFELRLDRTVAGIDAASTIPWTLRREGDLAVSGDAPIGPQRPGPPQHMTALPVKPPNAVRVVTWNLEFGNLVKQSAVTRRLLAALQPDVLLLQEIERGQTESALMAVIEAAGGDWTLELGPLGGSIRSGIASRLPAQRVEAFDNLKRRGESRGHVRAAALTIDFPDVGRVLAVSAHLKCCGVVDGPEDMKRIGEVLAIRRAVQHAEQSNDVVGLIIGGDLNLVGGSLPLDLLVAGGEALILDDSERDLRIIEAWQPDGSGLQTWQKPGQSYSPGRLDYIVVSPQTLAPVFAAVFDTLDLPEPSLREMNLVRTDAGRASDHLPVVVDLVPVNLVPVDPGSATAGAP